LASAVALHVVSRASMGLMRALSGGVLMGGGISATHYIGMDAMRMPATLTFSSGLIAISVSLAIVISSAALWMTFRLRHATAVWNSGKAIGVLLMGTAIPLMHYTAMSAVTFVPSTTGHQDLSHAVNVSALSVAGIAIATFAVLSTAVLASIRFESLPTARQLATRYFVSLGVIGLLAILGTLLVQHQGRQTQTDASLINTAGRQRMLSQAITNKAIRVAASRDPVERQRLVEKLGDLLAQWEQSHVSLQRGDPSSGAFEANNPRIRNLFLSVAPHHESMISATRALIAHAAGQGAPVDVTSEVNSILGHEESFLDGMHAIVQQYERGAISRNKRKDQLNLVLLLLIFGALLVQGLVVLRPALIRTQQVIKQLNRTKQELRRKGTFVHLLQVVAAAANRATSIDTALQFTIDQICRRTRWPVGHVYLRAPGATRGLIPSPLWHLDDPAQFATFREVTDRTPLAIGVGLPGRVAESAKPAWIPDINADVNFPRREVALNLGVKGAFAFPVLAQGEVVAVLEFFSNCVEEPDDELLAVMANVGAQLGQVVERTRAQEVVLHKAEELARSNADLERFAYVASHDLQEPLRMVASYTQLLARRYRGRLDADADDFICFAVDGATRMQTLIDDLLLYSRVTSKGKSFRPVDTAAACKTACENLHKAIEDSTAEISADSLPTVLADAGQFAQLFQNLIGNALKYCNERVPRIQVSAKEVGKDWVFAVRDNGIGIDSRYSERIFQMFQRLHTRDEYSGTGIGLAICRKIVERHGGRIWVESNPGQGSTFLFTVPRREEEDT
jgi:signal transduction histidine kinase